VAGRCAGRGCALIRQLTAPSRDLYTINSIVLQAYFPIPMHAIATNTATCDPFRQLTTGN